MVGNPCDLVHIHKQANLPGVVPLLSLSLSSSPESFLASSAADLENLASLKRTDCVSCAGRRPAALFFKPCAMPASTAPEKKHTVYYGMN